MDIVKHKCYQNSHHDSDYGSSDIRLVKEENNTKYKQNKRHKSSCKSIKSISDIDSIDDRDSREEGKYRIK